MKPVCLTMLAILLGTLSLQAQSLGLNTTGTTPDPSAMLDVQSTSKGVLIPRMNSFQRNAIPSPATGLLVFDTMAGSFFYYNGSNWIELEAGLNDGLTDADNDTRIQVESSPDEDVIRMEAAGNDLLQLSEAGLNAPGTYFPLFSGPLPATGSGTRLMWVPEIGAFRAGVVPGSQWDLANVGRFSSVSGGYGNVASGDGAFAGGGFRDTAAGNFSFVAGGEDNHASGESSFIGGGIANQATELGAATLGGLQDSAYGEYALAAGGEKNHAGGKWSFVGGGWQNRVLNRNGFIGGSVGCFVGRPGGLGGGGAIISGNLDTVKGNNAFIGAASRSVAGGSNSFIGGGNLNETTREYSTVMGGSYNAAGGRNTFIGGGIGNSAPSFAEAAFGTYPIVYAPVSTSSINSYDRLFVVGNGTSDTDRSNALTILKNGNVGLHTVSPSAKFSIRNPRHQTTSLRIRHDASSPYNEMGLDIFIENKGMGNVPPSRTRGVYASARTTGAEVQGGYFSASTTASNGAEAFGVIGFATNDNGDGISYGVYGAAAGTTTGAKYAGYFNGDVFSAGAYLPSDRALKSTLVPSASVLDKILALQVANYTYLHDRYPHMNLPQGQRTGLIAQNVATLMPELVKDAIQPATSSAEAEAGMPAGPEIHFQAVDYTGVVPYLVKAMQEQQTLIKQLQARLDELEQE